MAKSHKFEIYNYTKDGFLSLFNSQTRQLQYLERYLSMLNAKVIIKEPKYFDRDYLAEFAAFYSVSSKGYANICERLHIFSEDIDRRTLKSAAANRNKRALNRLQASYLGFIVVRPIPAAPLGRTVIKWFPDDYIETTPRVVEPSREYDVHIAGIKLSVRGLAWQQQDTGVGACATVSLWTMFHSSAFDHHHAIPTTADITKDAHKKHSFGIRLFPSKGLTIEQIYEAIIERDLVPLIVEGDVKAENGTTLGFSKDRFASTYASFLRSAYPVLIVGEFITQDDIYFGEHAVCGVGFRSCIPETTVPGMTDLEDSNIEILYLHDDNLGPNVRFKINHYTRMLSSELVNSSVDAKPIISLIPDPPSSDLTYPSHPTDNYGTFLPTTLIVAAHSDIRTDPDTLHKAAIMHGADIAEMFNQIADTHHLEKTGFKASARFMKITDYIGNELGDRLNNSPEILSKVRMCLCEEVPPMSLHIGVVRIGVDDANVMLDILYDTTDSDRNHPIFAHVAYNNFIVQVVKLLEKAGKGQYGVCVKAYLSRL